MLLLLLSPPLPFLGSRTCTLICVPLIIMPAFVGEEILRPYMSIINLNPDETPPQDKIYQNTVLAIPVDISISQRKPMLNRFLEEILQNPSITKQHIFLEFIDQVNPNIQISISSLLISLQSETTSDSSDPDVDFDA